MPGDARPPNAWSPRSTFHAKRRPPLLIEGTLPSILLTFAMEPRGGGRPIPPAATVSTASIATMGSPRGIYLYVYDDALGQPDHQRRSPEFRRILRPTGRRRPARRA